MITAGLAEIAAGSIAMGLGGYLAVGSDADHNASERRREEREVVEVPEREAQEIVDLLQQYGMSPAESAPVVTVLRARPEAWVRFMMRFELGLEEPNPRRAFTSAATIAASYIAGGMILLVPYFVARTTHGALAIFGFVKGRFTGISRLKDALPTLLVGGLAAAAAFGLAKALA